jgi:sialate O-acetylesterase
MNKQIPRLFILPFLLLAASAGAKPTPAGLFTDHCVLQRDLPIPVWGKADPGENVTVEFAGQKKAAKADPNGKWRLKLDPLPASAESRSLKINETVISDVLVGDVWLASGQSNMGFTVKGALNPEEEIAKSADPLLRLFNVDRKPSVTILDDTKGQWELADPKTVGNWSAASYFYARQLRAKLKVPIGVLHSSWGGVAAESWSSKESLDTVPEFKQYAETQLAELQRLPEDEKSFPIRLEAWIKANHAEDAGNQGLAEGYAKPDFDDSSWQTVKTRQRLSDYGMKGGGVVWYRKSIDLPEGADKENFLLSTDWLSGSFDVYFNGTEVKSAFPLPKFSGRQYRFIVPKSIILAGKPNVIAIRQYALTPQDSFWQVTSAMGLPVPDPKALNNDWKFKIEQQFPPLTPEAVQNVPKYPKAQLYSTATVLYNGMLAPLIPYGLKGAIWYQGESNVPRSAEYPKLLSLLINDWRTRWGQGDFPFYIVQLANYGGPAVVPEEKGVANLREAQLEVIQTVPNTGMAVAIDVGEESIHPRNKQEVGRRLALVALAKTYHQKEPFSGPIYESMKIEGSKARITFKFTEGGLVAKNGALKHFAIAGEDKKFVWAEAKIEGDSVVVSSPEVPKPVAVRYAWANNPEGCNLYNGAGLPASPFRTDKW